ncbi:CIA30 family protein [candidate division KSB3 bacterium]|uniref:CIA30 family protein n=1 Tax=candidate division KSB3 bacterium TaxID=2044937 RepID=A0A9D5Q6N3_9BACT|nr:CIA30 family protein [candidate division KSB3 bacterium]MBD3325965.1 CIA30 family protein [candidate division KSB3 bacterium]
MPEEVQRWRIINDGVMGGISQSELLMTSAGTAIFRGEVSLENSGGFASVRTMSTDFHLEGYEGLIVRLKGDGQTYQLRLRTDDAFDGIAYRAKFDTQADTWQRVRVAFEDCVPSFRGRVLRDKPPLEGAHIRQIGFLISEKQAGPFHLEIDWIKAYQAE